MEKIKEKITIGIIAILSALAGFGGNTYLTPDQIDNGYICPLNDNIGVFHRLSTSGKTGYYYDLDNNEIKVSCRSGRVFEPWMSLKQYAQEHGVNLIEPKQEEQYKSSGTRVYNCNPGGCTEK